MRLSSPVRLPRRSRTILLSQSKCAGGGIEEKTSKRSRGLLNDFDGRLICYEKGHLCMSQDQVGLGNIGLCLMCCEDRKKREGEEKACDMYCIMLATFLHWHVQRSRQTRVFF